MSIHSLLLLVNNGYQDHSLSSLIGQSSLFSLVRRPAQVGLDTRFLQLAAQVVEQPWRGPQGPVPSAEDFCCRGWGEVLTKGSLKTQKVF